MLGIAFELVVALALALLATPVVAHAQAGSTFLVTSTADSGLGTLRQAILDANALPGTDTIAFALPGTGVVRLDVLTPLPEVTDSVLIDGSTQPGYSGTPLIELNGTHLPDNGALVSGLVIAGTNTTVRALAIGGFSRSGIYMRGERYTVGNNVIEGCHIGTNAAGTVANPNLSEGVYLDQSDGNRIGGRTAAARNVISGNGPDSDGGVPGGIVLGAYSGYNVIEGNRIGTDVSGLLPLPNFGAGIRGKRLSGSSTIGGLDPGAGNVIAFNDSAGIWVEGFNAILSNSIFGNGSGSERGSYGIRLEQSFASPPRITYVGSEGAGTRIEGGVRVGSARGAMVRIEAFRAESIDRDGRAQGKTLVGAFETIPDTDGFAAFSILSAVRVPDEIITATVYLSRLKTSSAFSPAIRDTGGCRLPLIVEALPSSNHYPTGRSLTLEVLATGSAPLQYQWYEQKPDEDAVAIPGATSASLTVTTSSETRYFVTATNACGSETSTSNINICDSSPPIHDQPVGSSVVTNSIVVLAAFGNRADLTSWYRGPRGDTSQLVQSSDRSEFVTPPLQETTTYWARLENGCGFTDSEAATVTVFPLPVIDSVQVKRNAAGVAKLILKGRGFIADSLVGVDGSGFARSAKVKEKKLTQSGALAGGMTIDEAIPSGREVRITVSSPTVAGSYVSVLYTRP